MNNLLRIPITCHSSTCSNFGAQRSSLRLRFKILCEHLTIRYLKCS